jgi:hypothetical protein
VPHILPEALARTLACKAAALPHFKHLLLDQHRLITRAGHSHALPTSYPHLLAEHAGTERGVGLLTALAETQRFTDVACFHVDLDPPGHMAGASMMQHLQLLPPICSASARSSPADGSWEEGMPAHRRSEPGSCTLPFLTELRLHIMALSGQGAAFGSTLVGLRSLQALKVTITDTVADSDLRSVVYCISELCNLTLLKWQHEGTRGTAAYAPSFVDMLCSHAQLRSLEFDFALEGPCEARAVGQAFSSLSQLASLHLGCGTCSLMSSLSPWLRPCLQHVSINAMCEQSGLAAFCMHAPQLPALVSLSLTGQSCTDDHLHALAACLPHLSALTMLYVTLLRSSVTVDTSHLPRPLHWACTAANASPPMHDMTNSDSLEHRQCHVHDVDGLGDCAEAGDEPWAKDAHEDGFEGGASAAECSMGWHVASLAAFARSISLLPHLQSLRLGLDVWTADMAALLFGPAETRIQPRGSQAACAAQHREGACSEAPPARTLAGLTDVNFFLPLGPSLRNSNHKTDMLLPPCHLFPQALCACSRLESLEAEHFILSRAAVAPLYTLSVLPHLHVLDLQAIHMSVPVARQLARALHGLELPCLTFLRVDIIAAAAADSSGVRFERFELLRFI